MSALTHGKKHCPLYTNIKIIQQNKIGYIIIIYIKLYLFIIYIQYKAEI